MKWALLVCVSRALSSLWHPAVILTAVTIKSQQRGRGREGHSNGQEIAHQQKTAKISGFKLTRRWRLIWIIAILCYLKAATGIFPIIDQKKLPKLRLSLCLVRELESNERELTRITISIIIHEYIVPGLYLEMKQLFFSNFNWEKNLYKISCIKCVLRSWQKKIKSKHTPKLSWFRREFYTFPNLDRAWVKNLNLNEVANINCLYNLTIRITMNWWNRLVIDSQTGSARFAYCP